MPSDAPVPPRFGSLIGLAARHWRRAVDQRLQPFDLTEATWLPLVRLAGRGVPMRQRDLAASLSVDSSSLVRPLALLEARGFIERGEDEGDRRAKAVVLTPLGRETVERVEGVSRALEAELLTRLDPADVAAARRVLALLPGLLAEAAEREQAE